MHPVNKISLHYKSWEAKSAHSDTILFLAAITSFSAYQDRTNGHFYKGNEKLLAENDAASQAPSAHLTKIYASGNDLFPFFAF